MSEIGATSTSQTLTGPLGAPYVARMDSSTRAGERSVEVELPAVPSSAAGARRAAEALEGAAHPEAVARARVLVSEIVAALSLAQGCGPIRLRLDAVDGRLRGEVASDAPHPSRLLSGWARLLVERLSDAWGESGHGRVVWFEVTSPAPTSARRFAR
jgi:hypothetical protein